MSRLEHPTPEASPARFAELMASLSYALDLAGGQPMGHALRSSLIGLRIADELGLDDAHKRGLYLGLLIKDAGCASSASDIFHFFGADEIEAQRASRIVDWHSSYDVAKYAAAANPSQSLVARARAVLYFTKHRASALATLTRARADAAAQIIRKLGLGDAAMECVCAIDERWDGTGGPNRMSAHGIPLMARIAAVAQAMDALSCAYDQATAFDILSQRVGTAFDPETVRVALSLRGNTRFWEDVNQRPRATLLALDLSVNKDIAETARINAICEAYATVVDTKSRYTNRHSTRVRQYAVEIGQHVGLDVSALETLSQAAMLHDIGKLSVPNTILEKRGTLSDSEWTRVKKYPAHTQQILKQITGFERLTEIACTHNERLNGSGYFRGLTAERLDAEMRIIAVADVFDALSTDRPQRDAMPLKQIFGILDKQSGEMLDAASIDALKTRYRYDTLANQTSGRRPVPA